MIRRQAPAKINLDLFVTGRRADGYHELDSLVVFGVVADELTFEPAAELELVVTGPFAEAVPHGEANLVLQAARLLADWAARRPQARIHLHKRIPPAAGLGGGSADAAATLLALAELWGIRWDLAEALELAAELGADVPVCLWGQTARMRGVGERLDPVRGLPPLPLVLVNPGVELATAQVFETFARHHRPQPAQRPPLPVTPTLPIFGWWLGQGRNDLEPAARSLAPVVAEVLGRLAACEGCLVARMSGSGPTVYGLFDRPTAARAAADALAAERPPWWIAHGVVETPP